MESKKSEVTEYLTSKMYNFLEPMLVDVMKTKPNNTVEFCIKWLEKYERKMILIQRTEKIMTILMKKTIPSMTLSSKRKEQL